MRLLLGNTFFTAVFAALLLVLPGAARADDVVPEAWIKGQTEAAGIGGIERRCRLSPGSADCQEAAVNIRRRACR